jgi:protein MpaA
MPQLARELRRLGKNVNGYFGETIDIASVLADCATAAREHGWNIEEIHPAPRLILGLTRPVSSHATRTTEHASRIYISTGIHGDEPAGPLAVRQLLQENQWPERAELWVCPCLNFAGFASNRRENPVGLDLNREYLNTQAEEIRSHIAWLKRQPHFDVSFCLHEDWESHGFYVYELNPGHEPSLAEIIVSRVAEVCPIDLSETIEGRPARNGIIRPDLDPRSRPQWPEAFFLITHKTRRSYTLEAPSDFPLSARVAALVAGVHAAVDGLVNPM